MSKLTVGVVGAGIMGRVHARVFQEMHDTEVVAVADLDRAKSETAAADLGIGRAFDDFREMYDSAKPAAVVIATPDFTHREPVVEAFRHGCHVLCEKPLATNLEDAQAMVEAAESAGRRLAVAYTLRGTPEYSTARETVQGGKIGKALIALSRKNDTIHVSTDYINWADKTSPVHFLGTHDIDALCWFMDDHVTEVFARGQKELLIGRGIDTYDAVQASLKFAGGASGLIENSWVYPNTFPTLVDAFTQIIGTEGTIIIDRVRQNVEIVTGEKYSYADKGVILGRVRGNLMVSDEQFVRWVLEDDDRYVCDGRDGLHRVAVACAIHRSLESGTPEPVD